MRNKPSLTKIKIRITIANLLICQGSLTPVSGRKSIGKPAGVEVVAGDSGDTAGVGVVGVLVAVEARLVAVGGGLVAVGGGLVAVGTG